MHPNTTDRRDRQEDALAVDALMSISRGRDRGPGPGPGPGPGLIGGRGRSRAEDQGQVGLDGVGPPYTSVSRPELVFPRPSLPPSPLRTAVIRSYCVCLRARMSFERLVLY